MDPSDFSKMVAALDFLRSTVYGCGSLKDESALKYLQSRGVSSDEFALYQVGFSVGVPVKRMDAAPEVFDWMVRRGAIKEIDDGSYIDGMANRIVFPIEDVYGRLVGFQGRALSPTHPVRYKQAFVSSSGVIYGLKHVLPKYYGGVVFMTEGIFDYFALRRCVENVVTAFSINISLRHARMLKRYFSKVILCFDAGEQDREGLERSEKMCNDQGLETAHLEIPQALKVKDWAAVYEKFGVESCKKLLDKLVAVDPMLNL